ncbi:nuclear transport factor 2 family protein [Burkholderia sp. Bp9142]|uniref:nuclear transport factor 2 family protein n=1 Tax=Burkholderia sp. Bp9142 TaxID=2184573 RepID=UPI000FB6EFAA|nr:nuclear transport factor 2 family protein [Burkholderia sp. Bp9142]RQR27554.1 nuclear transport factor 2 family protein [Burkholderia sp. Bp9142]
MSNAHQDSRNVTAVKEYFIRGDTGRADLFDLFTEDFQFYFPKFGVGRGKAEFTELATKLLGTLKSISHDIDAMKFFEGPDFIVVEGTTDGEYGDGTRWSGGKTSGGRYCSVFEFRDDGLIERMHIYLDPDYAGHDSDRFLWGTNRTW